MPAVKKIGFAFLLGLLVLGGLTLGLYFKKINSSDSTVSKDDSVAVNWTTFTSQSCGFAVDYPSDWIVIDKKDTSLMIMDSEEFAFEEAARKNGMLFESYGFTAFINCAMDLVDLAKQSGDEDFRSGDTLEDVLSANDQQVKKITLANYDAYEVIIGGLGVVDEVVINSGGHIYLLAFPDVDSLDKLGPNKQRILDSFRLTN